MQMMDQNGKGIPECSFALFGESRKQSQLKDANSSPNFRGRFVTMYVGASGTKVAPNASVSKSDNEEDGPALNKEWIESTTRLGIGPSL
ncbi:hypothetical protein VM1G_11381 [Cytospora mali]|uniref:Uncharacterized protein n=1 Tax=Cytospora mali TaxID=578113 RepID=A0A194VRE6_CYTMA|nr:hypothetical protein VM1G_11381 [Valsa mali]